MNKIKFIFPLFFALLAFNSMAQTTDSDQEKLIEFTQKFSYESASRIFKTEKLLYIIREEYVFPWSIKYDRQELLTALDSINKSAKVSIDKDLFGREFRLCLTSQFPVDPEDYDRKFKLHLTGYKLIDSLNRDLKLYDYTHTGYSLATESRFYEGVNTTKRWGVISPAISFNPGIKTKNVRGTISFRAAFVTGFENVKITKQDKGKEFTLNNQKFKVIDIFENSVVLLPLNNSKLNDIDVVNVNEKKQKIDSYSLNEFDELKQKDSTLKFPSVNEKFTIYQFEYIQFKKNPNLEFDEFKKNTFQAYLDVMNSKEKDAATKILGPKYIIILTPGPIQNLYLYYTQYGATKDMEFKVN